MGIELTSLPPLRQCRHFTALGLTTAHMPHQASFAPYTGQEAQTFTEADGDDPSISAPLGQMGVFHFLQGRWLRGPLKCFDHLQLLPLGRCSASVLG